MNASNPASDESRLRLAGLVDSAMDAIITIDEAQNVVLFNPAAERMFRCSSSDALARSVDRFIPARFRDAHRGHVRTFGQTGATSRQGGALGTISGVRADGEEFPIEASISQVATSEGKFYTIILRDITERKKAQQALAESEERFRQMAGQIRDVFFLIDLKTGGILYISPAYEEIWKRSCDSLYADSSSWVAAVHSDDRDRVIQLFGEQQKTGFFDSEYRIVRPDGAVRWIRARAYPIHDEPGKLYRSVGNAEDITERKKAEQSLQDRAQIAALGADVGAALTRGVTLTDILQLCCDAVVKHLHAAFARIWTFNEQENMLELRASAGMYTHLDGAHGRVPVGKFKIGLIAQERKPHLTNQVVGDPRVSDQAWAKREGMVAFAGYPLLVADHLVGVVAMFSRNTLAEVTLQGLASVSNTIALGIERKRATDELRESERRFSDMLGNIELISVMLARDGRITYCNDYLLGLTGWTREELLGRSWFELFIPPELDETRGLFADLLANLPHTWHHENEILTRSGERRLIRWNNSVLRSVSGEVIGTASIGEDVTERMRTLEALRQSEYRLDLALEASALATWEWNFVTGEVSLSRHWWPILGYEPNEVPSRIEAWETLTQPEDLVRLNSMVATVMKQPHLVLDVEYRMWAKNGELRWIRSVGRVVERDAAGRALRMTGTHGDITEHKRAERELHESETKYRGLIEQAGDGILITDAKGSYQLVNSRACELLGYARSEMIGMHGSMTHLEEDRETYSSRLQSIVEGKVLRYERMMRRKDGSVFPADVSAKKLGDNVVHIFHDITNRRAQETRIARLSRIQSVLSGINSAIVRIRDRQQLFDEACLIAVKFGGFSIGWIAKLDHASGTLVPISQAGLPMDFGAGDDASNRPVGLAPGGTAEVALREKRPAFDNDIERSLHEIGSEVGSDTLSVERTAIGLGAKSVIVLPLLVEEQIFGILTLYAPERNFFDDEEIKLLTELAGDVSFGLEFIAKEEKVDYLAYYDVLTGLPNRSLFFDRLTHQLGTAARDGLNVALLLMDLDRFGLVNDTLGRQAGDSLINKVAHRIKDSFRDQDTLARVGADSFAIAVSGTWRADYTTRFLESHNLQLFGQPFLLGKEELRVSATFGVAVFPGDGNSPETLFANAEAALKNAKSGGERLLFYGPEMNASVADSLRQENRLRHALENGEMVLWYQPKVSVRTRAILGFEALMRWQDPETGMVPPAKFIPLMEQTGLILDAGRWAMLQVARDCRQWAADGFKAPRVAVNVSPIQLRQKDFVATVVEAAQKTEEAGSMLDIEITESVIMENVETIIPKLQAIRGLGVEIAVDDFGTGYSSLAYIARLPIHDLKIDRSFIVGMTKSEDSLTIVRSVISLAHSLRLNVVAEGVETEEQAALLLELGCDEMQGYLISKPVAPEQVPGLFRKQMHSSSASPPRKISATTKSSRDGKKKAKKGTP